MENNHKSREWVKTAAIIFLAVLLVLTFFSNTIQNMALPEVSTVAIEDGTISGSIRVSGKVKANGSNQVKAEGTRTIAAVKVKAGQEVSEGDILFVMGEAGTEELETAKDARDTAYYAHQRTQASYPINTSSGALANATEAMHMANVRKEEAKDAYDRALDSSDTKKKEAYDDMIAKEKIYLDAEKEYNDRQNTINLNISKAEEALNRAEAEKAYSDEAYYNNPVIPDPPPPPQSTVPSSGESDPAPQEPSASSQVNPYEGNKKANDIKYENALKDFQIAQSATNEKEDAYNKAKLDYENAVAKYDSITDAGLAPYEAGLTAAENAYNSAVATYESAYSSNATAQAQYAQSYQQAKINEDEAANTLEKKEEKVANLEGTGEDINVYAKISGIVETVNFSSGDKVIKDDIMCTIEVPDMGYTMEASVTKDQANRVKVGDVGEAVQYYWGTSKTGTISTIKADPKSPQDKRILVFEMDGNVASGEEVTLTVGEKSAKYDYLVPKSAVKSDNNGNFVLVIESKSNALGNRYFAKRVNVEILAEDDSHRAISGDVGYGDFIITNSNTKVNAGDQVKLADAS